MSKSMMLTTGLSVAFCLLVAACSSDDAPTVVVVVDAGSDSGCSLYASKCANGVCSCGASVTHAGEQCCGADSAPDCTLEACSRVCCDRSRAGGPVNTLARTSFDTENE